MSSADDFLTRLNAVIDQAEQRALARKPPWSAAPQGYLEYISNAEDDLVVSGGRWGGEASVFAEDADAELIVEAVNARLRNIAEDRAVLQRHTQLGNGCCSRCCDWDGSFVVWPCEEWLGVANRYLITEEPA